MPFYKQPLLHFLLLGAVLFAVYEWRYGNVLTPRADMVSRASFIEFIQYRHRGISAAAATQLLATMPDAQRAALLNAHIKEEVLYHDALALGLNHKDYVLKQRLIQKMEYLLSDNTAAADSPSQAAVSDYYQRHSQRYSSPATISFSHVFIDNSQRDTATARALATALKAKLNAEAVPFEQAAQFGERFVYFTNYVERDANFVASHFGAEFAKALFAAPLSTETSNGWQGPFSSQYGEHIVWLAQHNTGGIPPLASIYSRVAQDLQQSIAAQQLAQAVAERVAHYGINTTQLLEQL